MHQLNVVGHGIDDLDANIADHRRAELAQIDIGAIGRRIAADGLRIGVNRVGDFFRRRAAVVHIEFNAEVAVRPARVVTGRENHAAKCAVFANDMRYGGRGQDAVLTDEDAREALRHRHFDDQLNRGVVVKATVAADHQRFAGKAVFGLDRRENRGDEVRQIVRLLKHGYFFAQTAGTRFLSVKWGGGVGDDIHSYAVPKSK